MSYPVLILGESGSGKSASMRNMDPVKTLLIQAIHKPLPFEDGWRWIPRNKDNPEGNIIGVWLLVCETDQRKRKLWQRH